VYLHRERRAWTLVYACLGVVEGGTAAVMVRALFDQQVFGIAVDLVLAMVAAAPAWANLASLAYARVAQGRPKVPFLQPLLFAMCACVAALALLPRSGVGLALFFLLYGVARVFWAGVETVRAVVWTVNYPRRLRARVTGSILIASSIALSISGLALGWLAERPGFGYRAWIVAAAAIGVAGTLQLGRLRVRRERRLLEAERASLARGARFDLASMRELLDRDAAFRRYMLAMSLFGAGNLMFIPVLVVCLDDVLHLSTAAQIAVTTALPVLTMPLSIRPWARYLDAHHVVVFRSVHGWFSVGVFALLAAALLLQARWLLWPGAFLYGVSLAASSLGWSLGHNDFAPRGEETRYMALHVTLTGLRGLAAPTLGILGYHALERRWPGTGAWAVLLPLALVIAGAAQFTALRRLRDA
jgi:MFS family permease